MTTDPPGSACSRAPCYARELTLELLVRRAPGPLGTRAAARIPSAGVAPCQRASAVTDGPAMTTHAMRCSVAVSAGCGRRHAAAREARERAAREHAVERRHDRLRVGQPLGRILGQHARDRVVEHVGIPGTSSRARRVLQQDLREQRRRLLGLEHGAPREALEEDAPEREHVGGGADVALAAHELGRHVAGRADDRAREGELAPAAREARDAKVEHLEARDVPARQEQVLGLDVAVDDPARVRVAERLGGAPREPTESAILRGARSSRVARSSPSSHSMAMKWSPPSTPCAM